jgi:hypothetical protein
MRNGIFVIGIVFAASLAYVVGNRLSPEAMAVVVGALCGISASIPVSIALFIAASRNWGQGETTRPQAVEPPRAYAPQPPFIVIAPPQFNPQQYPQLPPQYFPAPMPNNMIESRDFKIIGEE